MCYSIHVRSLKLINLLLRVASNWPFNFFSSSVSNMFNVARSVISSFIIHNELASMSFCAVLSIRRSNFGLVFIFVSSCLSMILFVSSIISGLRNARPSKAGKLVFVSGRTTLTLLMASLAKKYENLEFGGGATAFWWWARWSQLHSHKWQVLWDWESGFGWSVWGCPSHCFLLHAVELTCP